MSLIGTPVARPDAHAKVTGAARYPADLVHAEMLHCKAVFGHRPHARIDGIDASRALALPGVVAVLTAADVPYNRYGLIDADQEVLCSERVRYVGDRVALVVAEDPDIAALAAKLVEVAYTDLPAVTDAQRVRSNPTRRWCIRSTAPTCCCTRRSARATPRARLPVATSC